MGQYLPTDLGDMPGFPDIGRDHPHLMSRTDGSVIDAKPYTHCGVSGSLYFLVCVRNWGVV